MAAISIVAVAVWTIGFVGVAYRLGSMQIEGLPAVALGVMALGFAYTSLLLNRARALEDGKTRRRTLAAAEVALRATVMYLLFLCISATAVSAMLNLGFTPKNLNWQSKQLTADLDFIPLIVAINCAGLAQFSAVAYFNSVKLLVRRGFIFGIKQEIYRRH